SRGVGRRGYSDGGIGTRNGAVGGIDGAARNREARTDRAFAKSLTRGERGQRGDGQKRRTESQLAPEDPGQRCVNALEVATSANRPERSPPLPTNCAVSAATVGLSTSARVRPRAYERTVRVMHSEKLGESLSTRSSERASVKSWPASVPVV